MSLSKGAITPAKRCPRQNWSSGWVERSRSCRLSTIVRRPGLSRESAGLTVSRPPVGATFKEAAMSQPWQSARRLLCVRLDALGDVLMTTPALRALKQTGASREITLLTSPAGAAIARHVPEIDEV